MTVRRAPTRSGCSPRSLAPFAAVALATLAACAGGQKAGKLPVWPAEPATARIKYVRTFASEEHLGAGGLRAFGRALVAKAAVGIVQPTGLAFSEDVLERFRAYGWQTLRVKDGTDVGAIEAAIRLARSDDRPSIVAVRTVIGYGSPNKAGSQKAHGAPLGPDEVRLTKEAYGWDPDKTFFVPDPVAGFFSRAILYGEGRAA